MAGESTEDSEAQADGASPRWGVDMQIDFFHAMKGHKPVGIDRHFQMIYISEKLSRAGNSEMSVAKIWSYLGSLYNLSILNDLETSPCSKWDREFQLTEADFGDVLGLEYPRVPRFACRGSFLDDARSDASGHSGPPAGAAASVGGRKRTRQGRGGAAGSRHQSPASSESTPRKRSGRH